MQRCSKFGALSRSVFKCSKYFFLKYSFGRHIFFNCGLSSLHKFSITLSGDILYIFKSKTFRCFRFFNKIIPFCKKKDKINLLDYKINQIFHNLVLNVYINFTFFKHSRFILKYFLIL